ncbi:alpha/beta hydrolase [Schaalia vaccimaxillae]|uniref:alpha/beta hydrolase n=1 Tax=Schaalia vaccimaxillae TaxID=183916 RepID=UPI0003B3B2AB|nr:alpha/beta hydrolase [Schaalia vaccimaxillae]
MFTPEQLNLTSEWDKTFPKSDLVSHSKITFVNRYGITLAADLYVPQDANTKLPGIAISGPFGAVKEQSSGLYAQRLAEAGFVTLAFDPSYTGESGGQPRFTASPDINTEDFLAAVDWLSNSDLVNPQQIGILGICGFGGMAINAAALDPRIKATVASTMYDLSRSAREGYFASTDSKEERDKLRQIWATQRTADFAAGQYARAGGVVDPLPEDAPFFVKDYYDYYKTERGYHERSGNSNEGWTVVGTMSLMNQPLLSMASEIDTPVLLIHGSDAHSLYFSEGAYELLTGDNKELMIIPGATHTDLYDGGGKDAIPFAKLESFFAENLK